MKQYKTNLFIYSSSHAQNIYPVQTELAIHSFKPNS